MITPGAGRNKETAVSRLRIERNFWPFDFGLVAVSYGVRGLFLGFRFIFVDLCIVVLEVVEMVWLCFWVYRIIVLFLDMWQDVFVNLLMLFCDFCEYCREIYEFLI